MNALDRVILLRADEQVESERLGGYHERDGWTIPESRGRSPVHPSKHGCRECGAKTRQHGYCKKHWERVEAGLPVDLDAYPTKVDVRRLRKTLRAQGVTP